MAQHPWQSDMTHRTKVFAASEAGFLVNSFLLEDAEGVVILDAQFLVSTARALRRELEAIGKPLRALVLSHPHPDHYNGAAVLLEGLGEVEILATRATAEGMRETAEAKRALWTPTYGEDYPQRFLHPTRLLSHGETIRFGDIALTVDERGPAEASSNTIFHAPATGELFASDLVYADCHPWLAEGRLAAWLEQLRITAARYPDATVVHAGHGPSGGLELLDAQARYIRRFEALVRAWAEAGRLTEAARAAVRQAMIDAYPSHPLRFLIDLNAEAVAAGLVETTEAGR